jgi:ubiquinone biosynthesis protein COQ9
MTLIKPLSTEENNLVQNLYLSVPFDGWHEHTLSTLNAQKICPDGIPDALALIAQKNDIAMEVAKSKLPWKTMGTTLRIQKLIEARFLAIHKETERQSLIWLALPSRKHILSRIAASSVDRLWNLAEDTSSTPQENSAQSKRKISLAILSVTTLFWLQDTSHRYQKTFQFLERRLEEHALFSKTLKRFKSLASSS